MSFLLYRVSATSARVVRVAPRISVSSRSPFSISAPVAKSPLDPVKDTLKSVDRTVSDAAVKGIEKGEQVSQATKEAVGINTSKVAGAAKETKGEVKGKAQELAGEAQGKAAELKGEAKGKAEEVKSKM
ncbi:hypothetical protein MMC08_003769 [Hypocenomyce scalaris]|nr:hypothetical protein [Hypocenomyce scalaris]